MRLPLSTRRLRTPLLASVCVAVLAAGTVSAATMANAAPATKTPVPIPAPSGAQAKHSLSPAALKALTSRPRALQAAGSAGSAEAGVPASGTYGFLLELTATPTLASAAKAPRGDKRAAKAAAGKQLLKVREVQRDVIRKLPSGSRVLYTTHNVLSGIAVVTDVKNLRALRQLAGVSSVHPIAPKKQENFYAVPLQGAPAAWENNGNLGADSTIAVIDTGIDYTHANFGGIGTTDAYKTALAGDASAPAAGFPSTKVVGGYDFAGDAYNAGSSDPAVSVPHPDANPLDCNGHGSHVAGTAAGYGENADGSTYAGNYNSATPFNIMKIGPGMAPKAKLYAYKVFGCSGSTSLISEAIDAAADPNGDGDPSDHVDVINISIGSDYSSPGDGDALTANAASLLGISVVASSGNGGDHPDVGGAPGNAVRAISVANSGGAGKPPVLGTVHVSSPDSVAGTYGAMRAIQYDWTRSPDMAGTLAAVPTSYRNSGCFGLRGDDAAAVRGKIAFLEWTDGGSQCSSAQRAAAAEDAGAIGVVLASDNESFPAGITGSGQIPVILVGQKTADLMRAHLSESVTIDATTASGFVPPIDSSDDDKLDDTSSRGVRGDGNVKPDVAAVGTNVLSTGMGTGDGGATYSGTSMAAPMVAGLAALVHTAHTAWNPEQVKADIMNTATQDVFDGRNHTGNTYGPNRVGSGRIRADAAVANSTLAYVIDDPGAVSVSFGTVEVTQKVQLTKTIKVQNLGDTPVAYDIAYHAITTVPGVDYVPSTTHVEIPAHSNTAFQLTLSIPDPSALTKTIDPTVKAFYLPYLADASGRVELTPTSGTRTSLRVPVYSAPRPASTMTSSTSLTAATGAATDTSLALTGHGVNQGTPYVDDITSKVAGFELQAMSPRAPICTVTVTTLCVSQPDDRAADLKYVGATSDAGMLAAQGRDALSGGTLAFAVSTQGAWRTPGSAQEIDVLIDTDNDNKPDYIAYTSANQGFLSFNVFSIADGYNVEQRDINKLGASDDTALFDSDTMMLPLYAWALNLPDVDHSRINYGVLTFGSTGMVDSVGVDGATGNLTKPLTIEVANPGVQLMGKYEDLYDTLIFNDLPGTIRVRTNSQTYATDNALGLLMVHFHNTVGSKAQVVQVKFKPRPTVTLTLAASTVRSGALVRATVTVSGITGVNPTGSVSVVVRPAGVTRDAGLRNGRATTSLLAPSKPGRYLVTAYYSGDASYVSGSSSDVVLTVR